ncbi:UNVERIFIED_CONTAM: putative mitochondrial protein [Sesamum radiatum]|uniref:Mitochondrial protein n=1 Tax=Sesamum radiatum TaxID=300843 RepID=A0AAW2Q1N5_SESRA
MNQVLASPFTPTEVKSVVFGMFPFKSPNPDGMPPVFFQKFWSIIAFELNHHIQSSRRPKGRHIALKLDMSKAYNRVERAFLHGTLLRLGFNHRFVELIMLFVSTVSYSLTLSGDQFGYFCPERGIRQGDLLSPYLFIFCLEVFSCLLQDAELWGRLSGVAVACQAPRVSHLLFADDTIIFYEATMEEIREGGRILRRYARASG